MSMNVRMNEGSEVRIKEGGAECGALYRIRRQARVRLLAVGLPLCAAVLLSTGGGLVTRATSSSPPGEVLYSEDFESGQAAGWDLPAGWGVIADGANGMLRGDGHSVATYLEDEWGDSTYIVRVRLNRGGVHLVYRTGGCIRYFVGFSEGSLTLNRTNPCGTHTELATKTGSWKTRRWYEIQIAGFDGTITIAIDGVVRLTYTDREPLLYGGIALEVLEGSQVEFDDIRVLGQRPPDLGLTWVRTGGPLGGLGYDIRMRLSDPDIMYVTDAFSGLHISADGGVSWSASNAGILARTGASGDAIPVFCVTIDPHDPDIVWCGTQNQRGIYRSTDGGRTWVERDNGIVEREGISFRGFTVDPRNSNIVYAAAELSSYAWAGETRTGRQFDLTNGVVYKTTDGGASWRPIWRGDDLARYVWIDPRNPERLYVSTGFFDREAANCDVARGIPGGVGVLKSEDGGTTWVELGRANDLGNLYVGSLYMHPKSPDILLAAAGNHAWRNGNGVYLSQDGGRTWRAVLEIGPEEAFGSVEFAVADPMIAYAGSDEAMYRSEDGGNTWRQVSEKHPWGPPGVCIGIAIDIQVDPRDADRLFVNAYGGGNFLSEDGGRTWTVASTGYTGANIHNLAVSPGDPSLVYAIGRSGPFKTVNGGQTWDGLTYQPATSPEWHTVALLPSSPTTVLISDEYDAMIYRSVDGGRHWVVAFHYSDVPPAGYAEWHGFKAIAVAPSDDHIAYAGMSHNSRYIDEGGREPSHGMYKSADGGATWRPCNDAVSARWNINAIAVDPLSAETVYVGTVDGGVLKTVNGGSRWIQINLGLRLLDVRSLAIDRANTATLFAGVENGGVYKSIDSGASWKQASNGMDAQAIVRSIVLDPTDSQTVYAADLRTGVFRSSDGGATWVKISDGLRTRAVKALAISSDGKVLYAATEGEGVFRLDLTPAGG